MKKFIAVAALAFAFGINGYAQESAAPAKSDAPAAEKSCKKDKKCHKDGKCAKKCDKDCSKGEKDCDCSKEKEAPKA